MSIPAPAVRDEIPADPPVPLGAYEAVIVRGNSGFVSGQFPIQGGQLRYGGRLGAELAAGDGARAARLCALNVLGQLRRSLGDDYARVALCRIEGYLAVTADFLDHATVLDGASRAFLEHLGERGRHARAVYSVTHLPQQAAMELVVDFALC